MPRKTCDILSAKPCFLADRKEGFSGNRAESEKSVFHPEVNSVQIIGEQKRKNSRLKTGAKFLGDTAPIFDR